MPRAILIILDSVGCGGASDAARYGDEGADTLGHIAEACAMGAGDRVGLRKGPLHIPHLVTLGLAHICEASTGKTCAGKTWTGKTFTSKTSTSKTSTSKTSTSEALAAAAMTGVAPPAGLWGYGVQTSQGKDTPSGHWEIAGAPMPFAWGYFTPTTQSFPDELVRAIVEQGQLPGILGNKHASGTSIIDELGAEHVTSGKPICYTSVDSVLQIAAHEEAFGLKRLYDLCSRVRVLVDPLNIGRVIARPFAGTEQTGFVRTSRRKDFAIPPPSETLLDRAAKHGRHIITVGKIGDIFAHRNTGEEIKAFGNEAMLQAALSGFARLRDGGFCFVNLVDFDTEFGHRRDVPGYAAALEAFDRQIPDLMAALKLGDVAIISADHGNDPTWRGTDHTREHVPILAFGPDFAGAELGRRESFADIGASIAAHLGLGPLGPGHSWWPQNLQNS